MRSMKLLAATAVLAAFVAGPVLAQDAGGTMSPTDTGKTTTSSSVKHHGTKKPKRHKKGAASTAPASEGAVTPAK